MATARGGWPGRWWGRGRAAEAHYALGEEIARRIFQPVMRASRVTVEQLAILEPALSETVGATLCLALREATDEAVRRRVPRQAAMDFMLGHLGIELAIAFEAFPEGKFSDGALQAIAEARPMLFRDGWLERVLAPETVVASVLQSAGLTAAGAGRWARAAGQRSDPRLRQGRPIGQRRVGQASRRLRQPRTTRVHS